MYVTCIKLYCMFCMTLYECFHQKKSVLFCCRLLRLLKYYTFTSFFLQVYFLPSAHITMWYKEYYKPTQFDQAVYGSINTKYRVESIEIRRQKRNKQINNNQDLPDIRILIDLKTSSSVIESSSEWANVSLGKSGFIGSTISMSLELRSFKKVKKINSYQHLVF
mgnify:CR=1 FL=1